MNLKIISTEKAVMKIEAENIITFETDKEKTKEEIKKEVEESFNVKVDKIRALIQRNKKIAYVKLNKKNPAIDIATKLGVI
ncbi:MAG TPA: 50S ribosomal protein L23 [Candidatus Nanoarchaeia archaeon]|nr:50S ribosomal protein L23 [Candidatus Nanoarchaeia archaeon]